MNDINISFFSGTNFNIFLQNYNIYVYDIEEEPLKVLNKFYLDFNRNLYNAFGIKSLKQFIINKLEIIENQLDLEIDGDNKIKVNNAFKQKLNDAFLNLKYKIYSKDQDIIIKKLYEINQALKVKDFTGTIYSNEFFKKLKNVIINCEMLYIENFIKNLEDYLGKIFIFNESLSQIKELENPSIKDIISILEKFLK